MKYYDVFNGDADGICSLLQLRLAQPKKSELITGIKRDIQLLEKTPAGKDDEVTALDISMHKNKSALQRILAAGAKVLYIDHHLSGEIPEHENLHAIIDTDPKICTSLLTNQYLKGSHARWAAVGAYGDNMQSSADALCKDAGVKTEERAELQKFGTVINYNGYGASIEDLHYHPAELYKLLLDYSDPLECVRDKSSVYRDLYAAYQSDIDKTTLLEPEFSSATVAVYLLPDQIWSRRVSGVFGNFLANHNPDLAHGIISHHPEGGYVVSVRAPKNNPRGAGELCSSFPTGGGREGAAGINRLPVEQLNNFIDSFEEAYKK